MVKLPLKKLILSRTVLRKWSGKQIGHKRFNTIHCKCLVSSAVILNSHCTNCYSMAMQTSFFYDFVWTIMALSTITEKSWNKFALLALFTPDVNTNSPTQSCTPLHIQCWKLVPAISPDLQHCIGRGGVTAKHFLKDSSAFFKKHFITLHKCRKDFIHNCRHTKGSENSWDTFGVWKRFIIFLLILKDPMLFSKGESSWEPQTKLSNYTTLMGFMAFNLLHGPCWTHLLLLGTKSQDVDLCSIKFNRSVINKVWLHSSLEFLSLLTINKSTSKIMFRTFNIGLNQGTNCKPGLKQGIDLSDRW